MTKWYGALLLAQYYQGLEYVAATVAAIILLSVARRPVHRRLVLDARGCTARSRSSASTRR